MEELDRTIYGIGETIYDIIFKDGKPVTGHPGGSTYNCMVSLGRCGLKGAFISETGKDIVGDMIIHFLEENGIDANYVNQFEEGKSALALAFLDENNDAVYQFYKDYPSQRLQVDPPEIAKGDILVYGSFFALNQAVRPMVKPIVEQAKKAGALVYYDPNYRATHVPNRDVLVKVLIENYCLSTLVRASDEDLKNIYPTLDLEEIYHEIAPYCSHLLVTSGSGPVSVFSGNKRIEIPVPQIKPVSTVGAGDSFNAGFIYALIENKLQTADIEDLTTKQWEKLVERASLFSAEVCMRYENFVSRDFIRKIS
jgi:fructokinase